MSDDWAKQWRDKPEREWVKQYRGPDCGPSDPALVKPGDIVRIWYYCDALDEQVVECGEWGMLVKPPGLQSVRVQEVGWDRLIGVVKR